MQREPEDLRGVRPDARPDRFDHMVTMEAKVVIAQQDDPELLEWLAAADRDGGGFISSFARACLVADDFNYPILKPALLVLRDKYPKYEPSDAVKREIEERRRNGMKAKELVDDLLLCGPQELNVVFQFLSDRVTQARLVDGQRLLDASDFVIWLRELAEEWHLMLLRESTGVRSSIYRQIEQNSAARSTASRVTCDDGRRRALYNTCPRCGHIHQGDSECGTPIGGDRVCRCELNVPA